jgi:hypothetical protein
MMRRLGFLAIVLAIAACGSEKRGYVDPNPVINTVTFDWPSTDVPLNKGALRIEGDLVAFYDTQARTGVGSKFKVFDGANDVTAQAKFGVRDARYAYVTGNEISPNLGSSDPLAMNTLLGAKVGDKVGFAHLVLVQQARTGDRRDATALIPQGQPASPSAVTVKVGGGVSRADVAINMDTTGSMGGSIEDLVTSLQTKIVPDLQKKIPDVAFGLIEHKDYPVGGYGGEGDFPAKIHKQMTTDAIAMKTALSALKASGGGDLPEAQVPSMMYALKETELKWQGGTTAKTATPTERTAPIGFRNGALPVMILVTDVDWHEAGHEAYDPLKVFDKFTIEDVAAAFKAVNARFVSITTEGKENEVQADQLSDLTNSNVPPDAFGTTCGAGKCCTGVSGVAREPAPSGRCRLNFLHRGGEGVSTSLINAILGLSIGTNFDVSAKASAATELPDASSLISAVKLLPAGDGAAMCNGAPVKDTNGDGTPDAYDNISAKTPVCFSIELSSNATLAPKTVPGLYAARVDVVGAPGQVLLDRRTIVLVVPPGS